ncbi:MAG TPA: RNA polymerase sigma factor [Streptosporangiaceae bacterium]
MRLFLAVEAQVRLAQRGDPLAMDALLTELAPWVGRVCCAIALDRGEDAMQETLITVLRNLPTLREPKALRAWVRRIAVRESLRLVSDHRAVPVPDLPEPPELPADDLDTALDVRQTLERLSPAQRAVLVLRHLEDLSEEETAQLLGVPEGTVKSRLHRAQRSFRERWEEG